MKPEQCHLSPRRHRHQRAMIWRTQQSSCIARYGNGTSSSRIRPGPFSERPGDEPAGQGRGRRTGDPGIALSVKGTGSRAINGTVVRGPTTTALVPLENSPPDAVYVFVSLTTRSDRPGERDPKNWCGELALASQEQRIPS